jgi:cytoskeletal protein CcmA (bactofilin family)
MSAMTTFTPPLRPLTRILSALALCLVAAGCNIQRHDDSVSKQVGADYFGVGGSLNLTDPTAGDAFLAGGRVSTAAEVKGDLVAAGGEVSIGGGIGDDLYAAGGEVQVDAVVTGNARLAGGDVAIGPATVIGGALTASGGRVRFEGNARERLHASGGSVFIDGTVQGDAEVEAEQIEIGPNTRITGKLVAHTSRAPEIPAGAQILGGVEFHAAEVGHVISDSDAQNLRTVAHGVGSFFWVLGVFVAGTLFMLIFPAYSARAAQWIGQEPLRSLGLGFVILVSLPVLFVLLLITIIGIPLALIVAMLYGLLLFLGWVTAALFVAQKLLGFLRSGAPVTLGWKLLALFLAVLGLWLLGFVPIVGGWIRFAALLLGIGALVWQGWPRREVAPQPAT